MPDFLTQLRMKNVFGGDTPMGMPDMSANDIDPYAGAQFGMQMRQDAANDNMNRQIQQMRLMRMYSPSGPQHHFEYQDGQLFDSNAPSQGRGNGPNGMNVVMGHDPNEMTGYQKAQIDLGNRQLNEKGRESNQNLGEKARESNVKDTNTDLDRKVKQQRADVYERVHNLSDADKMTLKNQADSGNIEARAMWQQALEEEKQQGREDLAKINNTARAGLETQRQTGALDAITKRIAGNKDTTKMKLDAATTKGPNATQQKADYWNKAQQVINSDPELAKHIQLGENGEFAITPPGTNFWGKPTGPTLDQYQKIKESIYGAPKPSTSPLYTNKPDDATPDITDVTKPDDKKKPATSGSKWAVTIK